MPHTARLGLFSIMCRYICSCSCRCARGRMAEAAGEIRRGKNGSHLELVIILLSTGLGSRGPSGEVEGCGPFLGEIRAEED